MQDIILDKPYRFVPPHRGNGWPNFIQYFNLYLWHLRRTEGIVDFEVRNAERLMASLASGHGVLIAPNHSRLGDPLVLGRLAKQARTHVFVMASWHLFNQSRFQAFAVQKMGGFSVHREGNDRQAVSTAIEILENAERPLVIFPEGVTTRTNDRVQPLLDGVTFIARSAAKRRKKQSGGRVVVHPVAIKYRLQGNLLAAVDPVLSEIEKRLAWLPQHHLPLRQRIEKVGRALLCLKELEYFGGPQIGTFQERLQNLIERLIGPLELEWLGQQATGPVIPRIKVIRQKLLPDMQQGNVTAQEKERRWRQLADTYLAQHVSCYQADYLTRPTAERLLETVQRFEEGLTYRVSVHGQLKAIVDVGEAIEVEPERDRSASVDPLLTAISTNLQSMLDQLGADIPIYEEERDKLP